MTEVSKCAAQIKEGPAGGSWELQVCQPDLGKVTRRIILSAIMWHMQDNPGIRSSWQGFGKGRSCLTNLISCGQVTCSAGEGKAVDVLSLLDFTTDFDVISCSIIQEKLGAHALGRCTLFAGLKTGWMARSRRNREQNYLQLVTRHRQGSPGLSTGASAVPHLY